MVPDRPKVWTDGRNGHAVDAKTICGLCTICAVSPESSLAQRPTFTKWEQMKAHVRIERGDRGSGPPPPLENQKL